MSQERNLVLLVEDDPNDILFVERAFRNLGVSTTLRVVNDGQEAMDYLLGRGRYQDRAAFPLPALMLLDLKLPRKSGHEVLSELRGHSGLRTIPVVVLTSSQEASDIERAKELGVRGYHTKPIGFDPTMRLLKDILSEFGLVAL
jgi:CheY-like chemotaxis protein